MWIRGPRSPPCQLILHKHGSSAPGPSGTISPSPPPESRRDDGLCLCFTSTCHCEQNKSNMDFIFDGKATLFCREALNIFGTDNGAGRMTNIPRPVTTVTGDAESMG